MSEAKWKMIDLDSGEDSAREFDPDEVILKIDENSTDTIPEGLAISLVKFEEVWLADKQTGEVVTQLASRSYYRCLSDEESDLMIAKIMGEGVTAKALSGYFTN